MTDSVTKVLLVDDDPLVRTGLRFMLGGGDITVVGEVADGRDVLAAVRESLPDVVLMDIRMPDVDGFSATRDISALPEPRPVVIMLTTFDADDNVVEAMRSGAAGYLLKHADPAEIVDAVRRAATGEPVLSPQAARSLIAHAATPRSSRAEQARRRLATLSESERRVAELVAEGLSNAEIGRRLYLSTGTVKTHVSSALAKLGLTGRIQLALLAHDAADSESR
ncbi:response regulator [Stackebrandtia soli]|uniref:response regulator n=1 Tax=Stackebrandtia soli TaxID=1892856 RepID=UPI0039ED8824